MLKPVQPRAGLSTRIFLHVAASGPDRQLVEQPAVVDLEQRRDVGDLLSGRSNQIRMRPVGAPDDAVEVGRDQRLGELRRVRIIGRREFRSPVSAEIFT